MSAPASAEEVLASLSALVPLERLPRTGWILAGAPAGESVAAHSLGAATVALALGPRVTPPLDTDRACAMLVVHDAPEALFGDLPREGAALLPEGAKRRAEERAGAKLLAPLSDHAHARFAEYLVQESREARFARLCDRLQLGVRLVAHRRAGARGLGDFRATLAELDCGEFAPCGELRDAILAAFDACGPDGPER